MTEEEASMRVLLTETMGLVDKLVAGYRALDGHHRERENALGLALLSAGTTVLLPLWGVERVTQGAQHMVVENALALMNAGGRA